MPHRSSNHLWRPLICGTLLVLALLLTACGSSGTSVSASAPGSSMSAHQSSASSNGSTSLSGTSSSAKSTTADSGISQYLIKSLKVSMMVKDTQQVAQDIQHWIATTDPRASSMGSDYEPAGGNLYNVTLSFAVEASLYSQVENYLATYAGQHGGQLMSLTETVQDVSNDYIDTQSRLTNLKTEQARLLTLLSQAQSLNDTLTIQNSLTDVEGQIENMEAHIQALKSQVAYYTISISLQPLAIALPPPPAQPGWSIAPVFHDAFSSSLAFAEGLLSLMVWLLAYVVYIIPLALIAWGVLQWRTRIRHMMPPPPMPMSPPMVPPSLEA